MANPNWKKGVSGNPNGRPPKGEALSDVLVNRADKEALADKIIELAMGGSETMLKYAYDRIYGKPVETVNQNVKQVPEYVGFRDINDTENQEVDSEQ